MSSRRFSTTKIVLVSLDASAGSRGPNSRSELETAHLPNLSQLATEAPRSDPRRAGITPGSGHGHLGLFGYDPLHYQVRAASSEARIDSTCAPGIAPARQFLHGRAARGASPIAGRRRLATDINVKH